jgi:hypothetical protein
MAVGKPITGTHPASEILTCEEQYLSILLVEIESAFRTCGELARAPHDRGPALRLGPRINSNTYFRVVRCSVIYLELADAHLLITGC